MLKCLKKAKENGVHKESLKTKSPLKKQRALASLISSVTRKKVTKKSSRKGTSVSTESSTDVTLSTPDITINVTEYVHERVLDAEMFAAVSPPSGVMLPGVEEDEDEDMRNAVSSDDFSDHVSESAETNEDSDLASSAEDSDLVSVYVSSTASEASNGVDGADEVEDEEAEEARELADQRAAGWDDESSWQLDAAVLASWSADVVAAATADDEESGSEAESDTEATTEFNPYQFIKNLPAREDWAIDKFLLPARDAHEHKICLVLDLDETLVHCSTDPVLNPDVIFPVVSNSFEYTVYARKRPFIEQFLAHVAQRFEVVVFTASQEVYADQLLNILDPERKYIKHRLFRDSCVCVEGNYLKDLTLLGRDLSQTIIVDNSPQAFGYHIDNGIPIESWFDDDLDTELEQLAEYLETFIGVHDVRPFLRDKYKLHEMIACA